MGAYFKVYTVLTSAHATIVPRTPKMTNAIEVASTLCLLDWIKATTTAAMLAIQAVIIALSVTRETDSSRATRLVPAGSCCQHIRHTHASAMTPAVHHANQGRKGGRYGDGCGDAGHRPDRDADESTAFTIDDVLLALTLQQTRDCLG